MRGGVICQLIPATHTTGICPSNPNPGHEDPDPVGQQLVRTRHQAARRLRHPFHTARRREERGQGDGERGEAAGSVLDHARTDSGSHGSASGNSASAPPSGRTGSPGETVHRIRRGTDLRRIVSARCDGGVPGGALTEADAAAGPDSPSTRNSDVDRPSEVDATGRRAPDVGGELRPVERRGAHAGGRRVRRRRDRAGRSWRVTPGRAAPSVQSRPLRAYPGGMTRQGGAWRT